ncbi:MAG: HAD-IA family hydrolase [Muribaculaceae bacterium]|nr:HAD-IA family hydrolase [Muribaculaceae bacterium]
MSERLNGIRWVWFDIDDTLWDFSHNSATALCSIYDDFGLSSRFASAEEWISQYESINLPLWDLYNRGKITKEFLQAERFYRTFVNAGFSGAELDRLDGMNEIYLDRLASQSVAVEGSHATLAELKRRGLHTGVVSNGFSGVQERKLKNAGLKVDVVVLSDEIDINKPDRRLFDYALQKSGATAEESLMVGDNPLTDIAGAIKAGWRSILYKPTAPAAAEGIIRSLPELLDIL